MHTVFEKIIETFVDRAQHNGLTKAKVSKLLGKDPGQINRTLSLPSNMTLEMLADIALAMGCEPEIELHKFEHATKHNFVHSSMTKYTTSSSHGPKITNSHSYTNLLTSNAPAESRNLSNTVSLSETILEPA